MQHNIKPGTCYLLKEPLGYWKHQTHQHRKLNFYIDNKTIHQRINNKIKTGELEDTNSKRSQTIQMNISTP